MSFQRYRSGGGCKNRRPSAGQRAEPRPLRSTRGRLCQPSACAPENAEGRADLRPAWGRSPAPTVPPVDGFAFAHEPATRPVDKRTRPPAPLPPPSLKKRSKALRTALLSLFDMRQRVPPRRRREGATLRGSGGATPCQGAANRRRAGRPGGSRSAKRATAFSLPPEGGSSCHSTTLDLTMPTAGAHSFSQRNY